MLIQAIEWVGLLSLPAFLLLDLVHRRRNYPTSVGWRLRALAVTALTFLVALKVGELWTAWLPEASLLPGARLGTWGGAAVGILVYELLHYAYHRTAHRFDGLWRAGHQVHHSAESLDAFGANYLHPLDNAIFTTLPILAFFPLLGLTAEAGAVAASFVAFNATFQHANIATPHWLGYLIQRPEMHELHHARGRHRSNYADLPLWDLVFGTFDNPRTAGREVGFYDGASARLPAMLVGRDVSRPPRPANVREGSATREKATAA